MAKKAATGINKSFDYSDDFAELTGKSKGSRGQAVKLFWDYVKGNDLQNPKNKRNILLDANLKALFDGQLKKGQKEITMFEVGGLLSPHLLDD